MRWLTGQHLHVICVDLSRTYYTVQCSVYIYCFIIKNIWLRYSKYTFQLACQSINSTFPYMCSMWQTCSSRVISTMDHQNQKPCNPTKALWTLATWLVGGGLEYFPPPCCYGVSGVGMVAFTKRCQCGQCSSFYDILWNAMGPFNSFQPFGSVWFLFWSILKIGMLGQLLGLCHP